MNMTFNAENAETAGKKRLLEPVVLGALDG